MVLRHKRLHNFVALVFRYITNANNAVARARLRMPRLQDFNFQAQFVSRSDCIRPFQFIHTHPDNAARDIHGIDKQAHRHRRGMPAARRQSAKQRFLRRVGIVMKYLRIKFPSEIHDRISGDWITGRNQTCADGEIFKCARHRLNHRGITARRTRWKTRLRKHFVNLACSCELTVGHEWLRAPKSPQPVYACVERKR